jgi:hypothetical protein
MKIKLFFSCKVIVVVCLIIVNESYIVFFESRNPFGIYLFLKRCKFHFVTKIKFGVIITHVFLEDVKSVVLKVRL